MEREKKVYFWNKVMKVIAYMQNTIIKKIKKICLICIMNYILDSCNVVV